MPPILRAAHCTKANTNRSYLHFYAYDRSTDRTTEVGQATGSRRPQSPVSQDVERRFRKMVEGITSTIDAASASLKESLSEVHRCLLSDLGDEERGVVGELEVFHSISLTFHPLLPSWICDHMLLLDQFAPYVCATLSFQQFRRSIALTPDRCLPPIF